MIPRLVACLIGLAAPASSLAQPAPDREERSMPGRILVTTPDCGLDLRQTIHLLRIELAGDGVDEVALDEQEPSQEVEQPPLAIILVAPVPCQPDAVELEVTIDDAVTRKQVKRVLVTDAASPEARPRALAIGIAELLRASWAELAWSGSVPQSPFGAWARRRLSVAATAGSAAVELGEPTGIQAPAEPAHPGEAPIPVPDDPFRLHAGFLVRAFPSGAASLLGGAAGVSLPFGSVPLAARLGLVAVLGRSEVRAGNITLSQLSVAGGIDLASEPGAPLSIAFGPVVELGLSTASGEPRAGSLRGAGSIATVLVGAHLMLRVPLFGGIEATLDLTGGYAVRGLEATVDGDSTNGLVGAHLDALIGIAVLPTGET